MTKNSTKQPLPFEQYEKFGIDQHYSAFIITFSNLTNQECDNFEFEYASKGYKIFQSEISRGNEGGLDFKLIVAKLDAIF